MSIRLAMSAVCPLTTAVHVVRVLHLYQMSLAGEEKPPEIVKLAI
jgi:hypothetical protein